MILQNDQIGGDFLSFRMFSEPGYIENASMRLSGVLADIGVNERIIMKRRRTFLLEESLYTISIRLNNSKDSVFNFGSKPEGTTTPGLHSDSDHVCCLNNFNVIQELKDWEHGLMNYLMIQDETISPGYCMLQRLRNDAPLPANYANVLHVRDMTGRVVLKNSVAFAPAAECFGRGERHGPAHSVQGQNIMTDTDIVYAFPCKTWPKPARQWLHNPGVEQGHSDRMMRYCRLSGSFVVGVGSKGSENEELEWRISTSLAERCLMFNLNITQIQCYVLMKLILKDFIKPFFPDSISSFMCKCILLHCIEHTHTRFWRKNNLLKCFSLYLDVLYNSILNENCPHYIIQENNLMRRHISPADKPFILDILRTIIHSEGRALLKIQCDLLGVRLHMKRLHIGYVFKTNDNISGHLTIYTLQSILQISDFYFKLLSQSSCQEFILTLHKHIFHLVTNIKQCKGIDKKACCLIVPWLCTTLGTSLASLNIQQNNAISTEAFNWISLGLNTDVASSKLKLASMLYQHGDTQRAETVLIDVERKYDINLVEPVCFCYEFSRVNKRAKRGFYAICGNHNEETLHFTTASCVRFLIREINCVPTELQHEMFRSTQQDLAFRTRIDNWMDCAVVDSLPYLYFLQYNIYSRQVRQDKKEVALSNLIRTIDQEPNLAHKETALNLLGQCMEQEDRARDALKCYIVSLNVRKRNNAAKFHICKLLSNMIQHR